MDYRYDYIKNDISGFRNISNVPDPGAFHLHNSYEIYLFLQGNVNYFVEQSMYYLKRGTLLLFNNQEIHKAANLSTEPYERLVINFNPQLMEKFTSENTDLLNCFRNRPKGQNNAILLSKKQLDIYLALATKLVESSKNQDYGDDALSLAYLIQILVFVNKLYKHYDIMLEQYPLSELLQNVIGYINTNLSEPLTLDVIENYFSINITHLGRLFKKETGLTIYNYILLRKITLAKQLLTEGYNVSEVCAMSGFNDYSNFIRTFRKFTGHSPTKYLKHHG